MTEKKISTHTGWTANDETGEWHAYLTVIIHPEHIDLALIESAYYDGVQKLIRQLDEAGFKEQAARYAK